MKHLIAQRRSDDNGSPSWLGLCPPPARSDHLTEPRSVLVLRDRILPQPRRCSRFHLISALSGLAGLSRTMLRCRTFCISFGGTDGSRCVPANGSQESQGLSGTLRPW